MFYLDVAKVDLVLHMLQCLYTYVASVCFKCFRCFQTYVASGLSGCCTSYTHTLQVYVFKCFSCFKRMLQMFYLDVAYVVVTIYTRMFQMYVASVLSGCYICCSGHTHILQEYVLNISSISYTCCSKCFMLQVFHEQTRKVGAGRGGPASTMVPMHGKRSGRDSRRMRMVAAGGIGPASAAGAACNHAYE
jgi:hypothetical protein